MFESEFPDYQDFVSQQVDNNWPDGRPNLTDEESDSPIHNSASKRSRKRKAVMESDTEAIPDTPERMENDNVSFSDSIGSFSDDSSPPETLKSKRIKIEGHRFSPPRNISQVIVISDDDDEDDNDNEIKK